MRLFGCAKPVESRSELDPNLPCQVKDNQGKLADALKGFFADAEAAGFGALPVSRSDMQYPKRSLRGRRKTADRLPDYRASLLGLTPRG